MPTARSSCRVRSLAYAAPANALTAILSDCAVERSRGADFRGDLGAVFPPYELSRPRPRRPRCQGAPITVIPAKAGTYPPDRHSRVGGNLPLDRHSRVGENPALLRRANAEFPLSL